jgi:benzoyl-CoA reductase/2-hydroxyglutaryl-CoA dehydratase subunit BcrC/BadD/HgdB
VLEVPQKKAEPDQDLWLKEVYNFKDMVEGLTNVRITPERLKETIKLVNKKRKLMQRINEFRKLDNPPISGLDTLLIAQIALNQDINTFNAKCVELIEELQQRVNQGISAYDKPGPRVMMAGTPSPMGNAKVHYVVESSGMQIVVDESCTGLRYFRDLVDETPDDLDGMMKAIADRYFKIDCPCFSPNKERTTNILETVKEYRVNGLVHNILQFCHGFNIEAKAIDMALSEINIPSIKIVTDYSDEDIEQLRVRTEAFAEVLGSGEAVTA